MNILLMSYTKIMNYDLDKLEFHNQDYEFVPKNEYKYIKDSKIINEYRNPVLNLNDSETLGDRTKENDDFSLRVTDEELPYYPLVKKELSLNQFKNVLTTLKLKFKNPNLNLKLKDNNINKNVYQYYLLKNGF